MNPDMTAQPKPGVIAIGSLQPEGSPHLVSVVGYRSDIAPFAALLNSPPGSILRVTEFQRFGDIRIQLMQSNTLTIELGEHYFPEPFPRSLVEVNQIKLEKILCRVRYIALLAVKSTIEPNFFLFRILIIFTFFSISH